MKCPHCQVEFFPHSYSTKIGTYDETVMVFPDGRLQPIDPMISAITCANCKLPIFRLRVEHKANSDVALDIQIYPRGGSFPPAPVEVPASIAADYTEANEVLTISPKSSAALSRRCLQGILSAHGYTDRDLVRQVDAAISEKDTSKALPTSLRENIDAIRNFGNFSAHPITDQTTLQIVDVEEGEAEWCLQILLDLFDHYYVAPAKAAAKRAALGAKLASAGKPPMKQ